MRYEDENIWLTQKIMVYCMMWKHIQLQWWDISDSLDKVIGSLSLQSYLKG